MITFHGQDRPDKISLFGVSKVVKDYVPQPRMCLNCLRYGHISANCRSKTRCKQCGGLADHKEENPCPNENSPPKCANCGGPHLPNSKDCPELGFQKELRAYDTRNRVTFAEAKSFLRPPKNQKNKYPPNPNSQPPAFKFSNFPEFAEVPAPGATNSSDSQTYVEALKNPRNSATPKPIKYQTTSVANSNGSFSQKKPRQIDLSSYYSLLNNGRIPSYLPRGFALNKPATGPAPSYPPLEEEEKLSYSNSASPSDLSSPITIIGLLMNLLTNLISSISKGTTPNEIESRDLLSTLNNCVNSLSSALIPDRDGQR